MVCRPAQRSLQTAFAQGCATHMAPATHAARKPGRSLPDCCSELLCVYILVLIQPHDKQLDSYTGGILVALRKACMTALTTDYTENTATAVAVRVAAQLPVQRLTRCGTDLQEHTFCAGCRPLGDLTMLWMAD